jgi:hypothetical protein
MRDGYDEEMVCLYQRMVEERHLIWYARQNNEPQPWTSDPVLANRKFTNMFRVLDPGSQFVFALNDSNPVDVITRLVFYRITNLPSTWYAMRTALGRFPLIDDIVNPTSLLEALYAHRAAGNRIFSGAYIIVPEPGTANDKIDGAVRVTQRFVEQGMHTFLATDSMEEKFQALRSIAGLGKFLSMQILTDWTYLQAEEPDLSFVVAGPGAQRGAALLNSTIKPEQVIREMHAEWTGHPLLVLEGRGLSPMDVQNTFCEFCKYAKERVNPRKKSPYQPSHPGVQARTILPAWW